MVYSINSYACFVLFCLTAFSVFFNHIKAIPLEFEMELKEIIVKDEVINTNSTFPKIITRGNLPLNVLSQEILTLKVCIGVPEQCFNVIFDTGSFHLWLPSIDSYGCRSCKFFDYNKSKTFERQNKKISLNYITGKARGWEVIDYLKVGAGLQKLHWMLAEYVAFDVEGADGIIGFARDYEGSSDNSYATDNYSLVDQLYKSKIIEKRVFSQNYTDKDLRKAKLYLGEYSDDFLSKFTYCNVIKSDPFMSKSALKNLWTCKLSYIIFGDIDIESFRSNSYKIYNRAVFDSGSNYIMAPRSISNIFYDIFTKIPGCTSENDIYTGTLIFICKEDVDFTLIPQLSFIFNGYAYSIPSDKLFKEITVAGVKHMFFTVIFSENLDFWLLGQYFLRNFHVLFDNERDIIGINGDNNYIHDFTSITDDNDFLLSEHTFLIISFFVIIALLIALVVYICSKKKRRKLIVISDNNIAFSSGILSDSNNYNRF